MMLLSYLLTYNTSLTRL